MLPPKKTEDWLHAWTIQNGDATQNANPTPFLIRLG